MKKAVSLVLVGVVTLSMGAMAFADSFKTPAENYANLADVTVEQAYELKGTDKTFGELAKNAEFLEEFQEANLESRKALLMQRVEEGVITQERANELLKMMEEIKCDGTNNHLLRDEMKLGFGRKSDGNGFKNRNGNREGNKDRNGNGIGRENNERKNGKGFRNNQ